MAAGVIAPGQAAQLLGAIAAQPKLVEVDAFDRRLEALEKRLGAANATLEHRIAKLESAASESPAFEQIVRCLPPLGEDGELAWSSAYPQFAQILGPFFTERGTKSQRYSERFSDPVERGLADTLGCALSENRCITDASIAIREPEPVPVSFALLTPSRRVLADASE
jgi:hypothetical protein